MGRKLYQLRTGDVLGACTATTRGGTPDTMAAHRDHRVFPSVQCTEVGVPLCDESNGSFRATSGLWPTTESGREVPVTRKAQRQPSLPIERPHGRGSASLGQAACRTRCHATPGRRRRYRTEYVAAGPSAPPDSERQTD